MVRFMRMDGERRGRMTRSGSGGKDLFGVSGGRRAVAVIHLDGTLDSCHATLSLKNSPPALAVSPLLVSLTHTHTH